MDVDFFIGLDFGQVQDHTALAVVERPAPANNGSQAARHASRSFSTYASPHHTSVSRHADSIPSSAPADEHLSRTPYRLALLGLPASLASIRAEAPIVPLRRNVPMCAAIFDRPDSPRRRRFEPPSTTAHPGGKAQQKRGLRANLWVTVCERILGGGNQRPQFPAPQTPHPPSLFLFRRGICTVSANERTASFSRSVATARRASANPRARGLWNWRRNSSEPGVAVFAGKHRVNRCFGP